LQVKFVLILRLIPCA